MERTRSRSSIATVGLALAALVVSLWGAAQRDAGAGTTAPPTKIYSDKSDCLDITRCGYIVDNEVSTKEISRIGLSDINNVIPGIDATIAYEMPISGNRVFGATGGPTSHPNFINFDAVVPRGSGASLWQPCSTAANTPPPYPCLRVPSSGVYTIVVRAVWEVDPGGVRAIGVNSIPGPDCDINVVDPVSHVWDNVEPIALPKDADEKHVQSGIATALLQKGDCITTHAIVGDVTQPVDLNLKLSMTNTSPG